MHPNKKILTSKNSPWLLCPSKSFPGKFYYFNGSTGETAWSLNDADKNVKKPTVVTDKTHAYPEPVEPPADDSNNTSLSDKHDPVHTKEFPNTLRYGFGNILNIKRSFNTRQNISTETCTSLGSGFNFTATNVGHGSCINDSVGNCPSPMFGQAVFPKYVPRDAVPKVVWALTPMLIPEQPTHKKTLDQITQYEPQGMFNSVSNRFQLSKNPFQFNKSTHQKNVPMFDQMFAPSFKREIFNPKPKSIDVGCQTADKPRVRTWALSKITPKTILKSSQSLEELMTISDDKSSSPNDNSAMNMEKLSALGENDLRFVLVAKRRQSVNLGDTPKSTEESSKQKTPSEKVDNKKRVTFALDDEDSTGDTQSNIVLSPDSLEMDCPESTGDVPETGDTWYLAVDTSVLLAEFECVEQFVLGDKNCRLLIPNVVKLKLEALSKDDCVGRQKTIAARHILRKLATLNTHVVVQRQTETLGACEEDAILKCCWQLLQESHVVLITDNTKLFDKAKIIDIECHNFVEFKVAIKQTETQDPFDLKKVKITIDNHEKPAQNLFQQTLEELNPFGFTVRVNYAPRTLFEKQNDVNRVFGKNDESDKLINLTNTNVALKTICNIDEIDEDISRLEITEQINKKNHSIENIFDIDDDDIINNQKVNREYQYISKDTIKISGITKLNTFFDLDDELKRFYIKSDVMEIRIKSKRDEWICRLTQIMEEALTVFLLKEKFHLKKNIPPWSLHEAIQVMVEKIKNQPKIKTIVLRFNTHLLNCSVNGKLNQNMKPIDLIKLIGFSMILVQNLKETIDYIEFDEADDKLSELIKNIEDPKTDVEFNLESLITPVLRRSDELESRTPMTYVNKQSEVLEYLKKHFPAIEDCEIEVPKIVRTTGKDLNTLKISNNKSVIVENAEVRETIEPKVIRNVTAIEAYEEKFKKLDMDELDHEDTIATVSSENDLDNKVVFIPNNEDTLKMNDFSECSVLEESLSSTFYNECLLACPLMKAFLTELRRTFMQVYSFITISMQDYQDRELYEDKIADINIKSNMAHNYIMKIVDRLQSIIARESGDGPTVKDLLVQAGDFVEEDETIAKYKELVSGYLEQAQILEEALKNLLALTGINPEMTPCS